MTRVARDLVSKFTSSLLAAALCAGAPALAQTAAPPPAAPKPAAPSPTAPKPGAWQFEFTPYLWGAGLDGEVKVGRLPAQGVEASFSDLLKVLDLGLMGTFEGRKGRWGLIVDALYFDLSETEPTPNNLYGDAEVGITQQLYSIGGTYRVAEGKTSVDLLGGVRYGDISADLELTSGIAAGRKAGDSINWWDGLVGARLLWRFAEHWTLVGYAEIGGGGTKLTWQALAGVDWKFSKHLAGKFGYRTMSIDYDQDDFVYDVAMAGGYAGLGIRF
jgi:hypothetical protein